MIISSFGDAANAISFFTTMHRPVILTRQFFHNLGLNKILTFVTLENFNNNIIILP